MTSRLGKLIKWSVALVVTLLVVAQFIPVDRSNPPVQSDVQAPAEVKAILVKACFDCHSHETRWPWYSRVAPLSWWINGHVVEGRKDLNFSRWPTFDFVTQDLLLREIDKQIENGKMPPRSYAVGHPEARLKDSERQALLDWVRTGQSDDSDLMY